MSSSVARVSAPVSLGSAGTPKTRGGIQKAHEQDSLCPVCAEDKSKRKGYLKQVRIGCAKCERLFHWNCVRLSSHESIESVETFYCPSCTLASAPTATPLSTTHKNQRKSSRASALNRLDYANLDAHLPADAHRWLRILATRPTVDHAFRHLTAAELTDEWLWGEDSMREPFVVDDEEGLGMEMPRADLRISEIAEVVGRDTPLEVIDCAAQEALAKWTLGQWAAYYEDAKRNKIRNVISLEVTESPLGKEITPPAFVRKLDWVANYWPETERGPGDYPTVMRYCLMSVAGGYTDYHCDFGGSCVFYNVRRGKKVFYFIRPTPANLAAYERWSGDKDLQDSTWLGDLVDCVYKVELTPGNTLTIPTGWIHAVYTPEDSLVFGGNYLHSLEIPTQLAVYRIELATKVPLKYRYPHFVRLMWMVAHRSAARLAALERDPGAAWPIDLGPRVLKGLKELSAFLIEQVGRFAKGSEESAGRQKVARDNVPWDIVEDPGETARGLRRVVMRRLGEAEDALCEERLTEVEVKAEEEWVPEGEVKVVGPKVATRASQSASPVAARLPLPVPALASPTAAAQPLVKAQPRKRKAPQPAGDAPPAKRKPAPGPRSKPATTTLNSSASPTPINLPPGHSSPPRPTKSPPPLGDLIASKQSPVVTTDFCEPRADPARPGEAARLASVRVCESTTTAVRRRVVDVPGEGEEEGMVVVETATVVTTRERVRIPRSEVAGWGAGGGRQEGVTDGRPASYPPGTFSHVPAPAR